MDSELLSRKRLYVIGLVAILVVVLGLVTVINNTGKVKVSIEVEPIDASITVNGKKTSRGEKRLAPGKYIFTATKEGYSVDKQTVVIENQATSVILLPLPTSSTAKKELSKDSERQAKREALGGEQANQKGLAIENANPIITKLPVDVINPYNGVFGPFSIDYGISTTRPNGIYLVVSNSSTKGRQNALAWIRNQGYDPVDFEIQFIDFNNPFAAEEER